MNAVFEKILEMSAVASIIIIAVLIVRLALSKAPKKYSYLMWSVVAFVSASNRAETVQECVECCILQQLQ